MNIPEDFEDEDEDMQFDIMFQDDRRDADNQESLDGDDNASNYSISQPIDTRRQRSTSANTSAASSATRVTDFTTVSNTNTATSNTGSTVRRSGQPTGDRVGRPTGSQGKRRRKKVARKRYRPYGSLVSCPAPFMHARERVWSKGSHFYVLEVRIILLQPNQERSHMT